MPRRVVLRNFLIGFHLTIAMVSIHQQVIVHTLVLYRNGDKQLVLIQATKCKYNCEVESLLAVSCMI